MDESELQNSSVASSAINALTAVTKVNRFSIAVLFGLWTLGCAWSAMTILRHHLIARKLVSNSKPLKKRSFDQHYRVLCSQLKISSPPALATTSNIGSPILVGALRPTILIPESVIGSCGPDELSLIVAHELAHAKRRDLLWNWLPVLVRTCFFFHPLVWLAQSRFALDQEIACDCLALNRTSVPSKKYANVLVKVSSSTSNHRTPSLAALGVASSFKTLKSRILEMNQFNRQTSQTTRLLTMTIVALGLFLTVPIDLVAQQEKSIRIDVADATTDQDDQEVNQRQRSASSTAATSAQNGISDSGPQTGHSDNISISVSENGVSESIQVNKQNGRVDVIFSAVVDGKKTVNKYTLDNIEMLANENKKAYEFYKDHVTVGPNGSTGMGSRATAGNRVRSGTGRFGFGNASRSRSPESNSIFDRNSDSSSQSSSSSAMQRSTSIGRNGRTRNSQTSSTTGNGTVGLGNTNGQMIDQINQMINQTDNAQMKQSLRQLLQQIRNK